jgi:hypothetical protein
MTPLGFEGSDSLQNLTESLLAAQLLSPGIYIVTHGRAYPADRVRKDHLCRSDRMTAPVDDLRSAAELIDKASELLREAAKASSLPSEAARQSVRELVMRIRLKLMLMRRDLTLLHDTANRRKPRGSGKTSAAGTNSDQDSKRHRS